MFEWQFEGDSGMASRSLGLNKQHTEKLSRRGDGSGGEGRCTESPPGPTTTPRQNLTTNLFVMRGGLDRDTVAPDRRLGEPSTLSSHRPVHHMAIGGGDFITRSNRLRADNYHAME